MIVDVGDVHRAEEILGGSDQERKTPPTGGFR